jgi:hypothetical protein
MLRTWDINPQVFHKNSWAVYGKMIKGDFIMGAGYSPSPDGVCAPHV